jgi:3-phosphoglycerate kinase
MAKKSVKDFDFSGKKTLLRVDFNVPVDKSGNITDDTRIASALPTIKYLIDNNARLIIMSHFGRPKNGPEDKFRLNAIGIRLQQLLGKEVNKLDHVIGPQVEKAVSEMKDRDIILLENVRFEPGETKNDPELSKKMASLGEIFVNDAFGSCHRAHCSTAGIAEYLPTAAGFLLHKEIEAFDLILENPERPFVAMIGGAKVSSKIGVIKKLMDLADVIIIGGGMAFTFYKALGYGIGSSLCEDEYIETAREAMDQAREKGIEFILPPDAVIADKFHEDSKTRIVDVREIPENWMGLDIGPESIEVIKKTLAQARTIVWNGPMGVFEIEKFSKGTFEIAAAVADSQARAIVGGGDSVAAVNKSGQADRIYHISTGGGASLEMLEGKELPGIAAVSDL